MAQQPLVTLGAGVFVLAVGALIKFGRLEFLIAGVGMGEDAPDPMVDVVGEYTLLVGLATVGLGALSWAGLDSPRLWRAYGAVVAVSALTLPFWSGPYYRLTPR